MEASILEVILANAESLSPSPNDNVKSALRKIFAGLDE